MAIYHEDIVNIDLESGTIHRSFLNHSIGCGDDDANRFGIRAYRNGVAETLGGTCAGYFIRADGATVVISDGVVSGNTAYVTLPEACYAVEGNFTLAIKVSGSGVTGTMRIVDGVVSRTSTSATVDPGTIIPSVEDLIEAIDDAVASVPAEYDDVWTTFAPNFSSSTAYKKRQYVTYDGALYRFTQDHAAGSWNSSHVTAVNVGGELYGLKSTTDELQSAVNDETNALESIVNTYNEAETLQCTAYSDRVKIIHAFYQVKNNAINRFILLRITTDDISSAGTWSIGTCSVPSFKLSENQIMPFTAVSLTGGNISNMAFRQNMTAATNLELVTTSSVSRGQGGIIMLTNSQPLNNIGSSLTLPADTVYPQELIDNTQLKKNIFSTFYRETGHFWNHANEEIGTATGYNYAVFRVLGGSSVILKGLSETLTSVGYGILSEDGTVLSGGGEQDGMIIDIPDNGYRLIVSYPSADESNMQLIPYIKKKIVVLGDSWSDNDPNHTTYTKWTSLLNADGRYKVIVYAQNGSSISGNTPNYGLNGNVAGQVERLESDNITNVDSIILFGGINDFRNGVTAQTVYNKIEEFYNELNELYPTARIIYVSNNQIYITQQQLDFFRDIHDYTRTVIGMESYDTFGWVKADHYIDDYVHVNDYGYKDIYANMLAILEGGNIHTVLNKHTVSVSDGGGGAVAVLDIWERFIDGTPEYIFKLNAYSSALGNSYDLQLSAINKDLLASVPFCKKLNKGYVSQIGATDAVISCEAQETFTTSMRLNTSNTLKLFVPSENAGTYFSDNYN